MDTKKLIILVLAALGVGYGVGRFLQPAEIVEKIQTVEVEKEVIRRDTVVIERETTKPDGTIITERETREKEEQGTVKEKEQISQKETKNQAQWTAGIGVKTDIRGFKPSYGAEIGRRVFGNVWVDAAGYDDGTALIKVRMEF